LTNIKSENINLSHYDKVQLIDYRNIDYFSITKVHKHQFKQT